MQQRFLLQILLLAQHVSGITMPIIRSSRVLYSGCCVWYFVLWFFKLLVWCGAEGCVSGLQDAAASRWHFISKYHHWKTIISNIKMIWSVSSLKVFRNAAFVTYVNYNAHTPATHPPIFPDSVKRKYFQLRRKRFGFTIGTKLHARTHTHTVECSHQISVSLHPKLFLPDGALQRKL